MLTHFNTETKELQQKDTFLRSLLMSVPVPVSVLLGPEHRYFLENDAHRILTRDRDLIGKTYREAFPDAAEQLLPILDHIYQTGEPFDVARQKVVFDRDNNGKQEDAYFALSWHALFDAAGKVEGVITATVDITGQVRAEEQLRESETRFRLMANAIPQMVWIADAAGRAIFFNQQWSNYTGSRTAMAEAEKVSENFIHPDDQANTIKAWQESLRTGQVFNLEHRIRSVAGEYRWFLVRAEPYRDPETQKIVQWFGTSTDIHDYKLSQAALRRSEERYRSLFNSIDEGFCIIEVMFDPSGNPVDYRFCETNPSFELQTGLSNVTGKSMRDLVPQAEQHWFDIYGRVAATGAPIRFENEARALGRWFDVYAFPAEDTGSHKVAILFTDITERKQTEEKIRHASLHDPLTGLPNRAMLYEYASHMLSHKHRNHQCSAILFFDLDRFKPINDTHGHEAGDTVLKEVASRLLQDIRAEDVAFRLGGDEFVVLLHDIKSAMSAADVARHLLAMICEPYQFGELSLSLSGSVGISIFPDDGQDIDTLLAHADMAMYQAKQAGRNNCQFYSPEFSAVTKRQNAIEQELKSALRDDAFHLCYQPVMDVSSGEIVSVEALLRLQNAEIGAEMFVPVAETSGIINPISRWLLHETSRQHKAWIDHGLGPIPIAVNVSVVEFRDRHFASRLQEILQKHGIGADALQVEITETAVMEHLDHAVALLTQLRALGVGVVLDDFGTGHSSLADLARLPLTKVKIDKSFISRLENDIASRAVTDAMIALGRTLRLEVVAEGIESENALDYVSAHGCTQAQGFYLGKPMSGESFEAWYLGYESNLKETGFRHSQLH